MALQYREITVIHKRRVILNLWWNTHLSNLIGGNITQKDTRYGSHIMQHKSHHSLEHQVAYVNTKCIFIEVTKDIRMPTAGTLESLNTFSKRYNIIMLSHL